MKPRCSSAPPRLPFVVLVLWVVLRGLVEPSSASASEPHPQVLVAASDDLARRIEGQTSDLDVELVRCDAPSDDADARQRAESALAFVWVVDGGAGIELHVVEGRGGASTQVVETPLGDGGLVRWFDEGDASASREVAAVFVRAALLALLDARTIAPVPVPEPAVAASEALVDDEPPPVLASPALPAETSPDELGARASLGPAMAFDGLAMHLGGQGALGLDYGRWRASLGTFIGAFADVDTRGVQLALQRTLPFVAVGWSVWREGPLELALDARAGVSITRRVTVAAPGVAPSEPAWLVDPALGVGVVATARLGPLALGLELSGVAHAPRRFELLVTEGDGVGTTRTLAEEWPLTVVVGLSVGVASGPR